MAGSVITARHEYIAAMMGGRSLSNVTPKTRIGQLVCDWIKWSEKVSYFVVIE